ncbi:hypothetical protein AYO22_09020 [Fonsecaea multimorphosa]|nr:hypothetical protein AYO22_09020 [Fonsecaea multimorphosa]
MHRETRAHLRTFKPLLRAYALGYLSVTAPRLFGFLSTLRRSHLPSREILSILRKILLTSTQLNRFPTAAAVIVGGATALPRLLQAILEFVLLSRRRGPSARLSRSLVACIRFLSSLWSAWLAFALLNRDETWVRRRAISRSNPNTDANALGTSTLHQPSPPSYHPHYAGKTIDFTAFAFCRALDVVVITLWTRTRTRSWHPEHRNPRLSNLIRNLADPSVFASSAAIVMWSWFYSPERLPRSYNHWISKAADIDPRLIQALRLARQGNFVYGEDTGQAPLLTGLCRKLNLPDEFADPAKTIPIPCCLACGWSVLLEKPSRRQEIAFFVAPRALATILPRVYDQRYRHREQAIFATSVAIVLTALNSGNERSVRGVLGRILAGILKD